MRNVKWAGTQTSMEWPYCSFFYCGVKLIPAGGPTVDESTITEKMAAVDFPSNALRSKIFNKSNGCLLKDRRKAGGDLFILLKFLIILFGVGFFLSFLKLSAGKGLDDCLSSLFSNFQLTLPMHSGEMYMTPFFCLDVLFGRFRTVPGLNFDMCIIPTRE